MLSSVDSRKNSKRLDITEVDGLGFARFLGDFPFKSLSCFSSPTTPGAEGRHDPVAYLYHPSRLPFHACALYFSPPVFVTHTAARRQGAALSSLAVITAASRAASRSCRKLFPSSSHHHHHHHQRRRWQKVVRGIEVLLPHGRTIGRTDMVKVQPPFLALASTHHC